MIWIKWLRAWQEQAAKLKAGEITQEDYDRWRYHYPAFDDTSIRVPIPTKEPTRPKRGRNSNEPQSSVIEVKQSDNGELWNENRRIKTDTKSPPICG